MNIKMMYEDEIAVFAINNSNKDALIAFPNITIVY
jgi:hypothetical protein